MERSHCSQARLWLECAKYMADREEETRNKYSVGVAMAVHAIIKANDALTFKFMNVTARRHDDARRLFEDMVKKHFVKANHANYKHIIQEAINNKAKAEYRGGFFSKKDFQEMLKKAERFVRMAEELVLW